MKIQKQTKQSNLNGTFAFATNTQQPDNKYKYFLSAVNQADICSSFWHNQLTKKIVSEKLFPKRGRRSLFWSCFSRANLAWGKKNACTVKT